MRGAKVIVTVGWLMTNATVAAAKLYPRVQFIGIDQVPARPLPRNYQGLDFDRAEAGYLAGIVAGWTTKTDKVGVVGGIANKPVLAFVNGYRNGVASVKATTTVQVLYTDSFDAPDVGEASAEALIAAGADVLFGVAGKTGAGVHQAACAAGKWSIGVDVDEYLRYPAYQACIVTSAVNRISLATAKAIRRWSTGRPGFQTGIYLNGAWNLAMPLAPIRNITPPPEPPRVAHRRGQVSGAGERVRDELGGGGGRRGRGEGRGGVGGRGRRGDGSRGRSPRCSRRRRSSAASEPSRRGSSRVGKARRPPCIAPLLQPLLLLLLRGSGREKGRGGGVRRRGHRR